MGRVARVDIGNQVYHVINRAVGRFRIFDSSADYKLFINLMHEARLMTDMRILAFVIMPNHWHLLLYPHSDGDLGVFMHWLTNAHTRRVHAQTKTVGTGPLYQGRYKSFLIENDTHLLTVMKYIERNPVRAGLSQSVEEWLWGSAHHRLTTTDAVKFIDESPVLLPHDYGGWVNTPDREDDLAQIRTSIKKNRPCGSVDWVSQMVDRFALDGTIRERGRPMSH